MTKDEARPPFHLAFPVDDLDLAREFYVGLLGCAEGRSAPTWVDLDFFGHQLSLHLRPAGAGAGAQGAVLARGAVDGEQVPLPHFGVVLERPAWERLARRLEESGVAFDIPPTVRFAGQKGEQATMFFLDPFGNALEIKGFERPEGLFER